ncbi:MAG: hypothetical protein ACLFQV_08125 [Vulcanimicrobiota bacterium]
MEKSVNLEVLESLKECNSRIKLGVFVILFLNSLLVLSLILSLVYPADVGSKLFRQEISTKGQVLQRWSVFVVFFVIFTLFGLIPIFQTFYQKQKYCFLKDKNLDRLENLIIKLAHINPANNSRTVELEIDKDGKKIECLGYLEKDEIYFFEPEKHEIFLVNLSEITLKKSKEYKGNNKKKYFLITPDKTYTIFIKANYCLKLKDWIAHWDMLHQKK